MKLERNLDAVIRAKTKDEFLVAKDILGVNGRFNQHDTYDIFAAWAAQHRFAWTCEILQYFTIGDWFCKHDIEERCGRQTYINDAMRYFCMLHKMSRPVTQV